MANKEGVAFPSVPTLARFIRMSDRNTQRVLQRLEVSGEVDIQKGEGPKGTHLYRVVMHQNLPLFNPQEGGDRLSPDKLTGDTQGHEGVTSSAKSGDTAMSSEPSVTNYRTTATPVDNFKKGESPAVKEVREAMEKAKAKRQPTEQPT